MPGSHKTPRIDRTRLPQHIGIIMDGNGRWAKQRGLARSEGHRSGSKAVRKVVRLCRKLGIPYLTLYAFSTENWGRPDEEVRTLMELLSESISNEWQEIIKRDIRLVHFGDIRKLPAGIRRKLKALTKASGNNRSMTLALALSYSGREEIARAAVRLARRVKEGKLRPEQIDPGRICSALYTRGIPDPDLIIRTGGERRISNFLIWQAAYAELYFSSDLWPDFGEKQLLAAIVDYQNRQRRFGLTDEQMDARKFMSGKRAGRAGQKPSRIKDSQHSNAKARKY